MAGPAARNLKAQVEVEVTVGPGTARREPAVPASRPGTESRGADEQPCGEPPSLSTQLRIGGRTEVGAQRDRGVGVRSQQLAEGVLVVPADRGRDLLEPTVRAGELVARQGAAPALADDFARGGPAQRPSRAAGRRTRAFPGRASGASGAAG